MQRVNVAFLTSNWKSTAQSVLTTTFALTGGLMVSDLISKKTAVILTAINGVCKIMLGIFQTDGIQLPPGSKLTQNSTLTTPPETKK